MSYFKHGFSKHPLYPIWQNMRTRCCNPKSPDYQHYGGRGIEICPQWKNGPVNFIEWAKKKRWRKGLYLDREKNDQGYYPNNCRFVSAGLSSRNRQLLREDNKTGYRGVFFVANRRKYVASIRINGKSKHLGYFENPMDAAIAYDSMATRLDDGRPINKK